MYVRRGSDGTVLSLSFCLFVCYKDHRKTVTVIVTEFLQEIGNNTGIMVIPVHF